MAKQRATKGSDAAGSKASIAQPSPAGAIENAPPKAAIQQHKVKASPGGASAKGAAKPEGKSGAGLKLESLITQVAQATGGKKSALKPVILAVLQQLGQALDRGEGLNLPGLGRARIARQAEKQGHSHITLKLKRDPRKNRQEDDTDPLADAGEDG